MRSKLRLLLALSGLLAACASKRDGLDSESHFACESDADCAVHDTRLTCVAHECTGPHANVVDTASGTGGGGNGGSGSSPDGAGAQAAPPPQAALTLKIGVTAGKVCAHTSPQMSVPADSVAGVIQELNCDLSTGCKPDEYVVFDRDRGVNLSCSVAPNGATYHVSARLSLDGTPTGSDSIQFGLDGLLSPTGGTASVSEHNSQAQGGGVDNTCQVTIAPPRGLVKAGAIWGDVHCDAFRDPTDISETGCTLDAIFLFEGCSE